MERMAQIYGFSSNIIFYFYAFLADAFIQSDLQYIQVIHFHKYVCSLGIEPTTFCKTDAMLYHWATQEQNRNLIQYYSLLI